MLKFDLARKYLVGLLTVAMVFSLFTLPIATAAPSPTVNAGAVGTINITRAPEPYLSTDPLSTGGNTYSATAITKDSGGFLSGTGTVYFRVRNAAGTQYCQKAQPTNNPTGTWTMTIAWTDLSGASAGTTYYLVAWWDYDGNGVWDQGSEPMSDPLEVIWKDPVPHDFSALFFASNPVGTTHTITVTVKDQFHDTIDATVTATITAGPNVGATINQTRSSTGVYVFTYTDADVHPPFVDTIEITVEGLSPITITKTWTYTPSPSGVTVNNDGSETPTAYNYVDETQTITVTVKDQYDLPYTGTLTLSFTATNMSGDATVTPTSGTITTNTGVFVLNFTNANGKAGTTGVTLTPSGFSFGETSTTFDKVWGYRPHATPEMETNLIGEIHTITVYGFPGDPIPILSKITGYPDLANVMTVSTTSGNFPPNGMAEFQFKCKIPGTYFFDFQGVTHYINGKWSETTTTYTIEVKKHWAEMTSIDVTPTLKINALTLTDADTHEVSATVLGEYPLWPGVTVPPVPPPLGGYYVVVADVIWVVDAPISGVPVTFEVTTSNAAFTPVPDEETAYTDSNGVATFSYTLSYSGTPTFHVCEITDSIKVTANYGDPLIAAEKGSFSQTVEKKWRDHAFKVIKFDITDPNTLLPGAKLFLRSVSDPDETIDTTTPTFVPVYASIYPSTPAVPGVVTTDNNGAAIWYHLPYGKYALYEYAPPTGYDLISGKIMEFVVSEDSPYWCGPDPKMEIYSLANTPTTPTIPVTPTDTVQFNKITYCYQYLIGAKFQAENLTTHVTYDATSVAPDGLVEWTNLPATNQPASNDTWYKVTEISVPSTDVKLVDPFYFRLDGTNGKWDDTFYSGPSTSSAPVWPVTSYEALPKAHYVINPKSLDGAYPAYFTILPASSSLVLPYETTQDLIANVLDQTMAPMVGKTVSLSKDFGTLSASSVVTGADGTAPFSISTTIKGAGTAHITGTIVLPHQTYNASATVEWTLSTPVITTVTLEPSSVELTLPGQKSQSFLVTVLDQYGDGMGGQVVNIWSDFGLLSNTNLTTNSLGMANFNITSNDPGVAHISATAVSKFATAIVTWILPTPPPEPTLYQLSLAASWNLVTPGVSSAKTAAELFGPNLLGVFHYDPTMPGPEGLGGYLVCTNQTLVPGWGYWVKMSAAYVADMTGTAVASPKTMALNKGWEQTGNPFPVDIPVSQVTITKNFVTKSLADAYAAGWISPLFSYDGSAYQILDLSSGVLHKGQGFWIKVLVDGCSITYTH